MATITTAPGLISIDPIQGLVDYVHEIKPYHTKVFEVLFEYVYQDNVNTTVKDVLQWNIEENQIYVSSDTDPALAGPTFANQFWYQPSAKTLYIRNTLNTGWIAFQTQLPAIPAGGGAVDTTVTEFIETISFDWGGDYTFEIAGVNDNQITVGGNYSNAILVGDVAQIDSNPPVEVTGILYDLINDQTVITVSDPTGAAVSGTLTIQNIDVTYWFAFGITDVNPIATPPSQSPDVPGDDGEPSARAATNALIASIDGGASDVPSITVMGNATTSVQIGTLFRITGSNSNDGVYKAVYVQYEPIGNTTTIGVGPNLGDGPISLDVDSSGQVVPYRFIDEVFTGSYDNGGYDAQPYDENAGSLIHQGP